MKKFLAILMLLIMLPAMCFASYSNETKTTAKTRKGGDVIIQSDTRTFDIMKGIYDLNGNVFVQLPAHDKTLTIKGDRTKVHFYQMEVHGNGNITLIYDDLNFKCDTVDVYHKQRTAFIAGNLNFVDGDTKITADKGSFNWKTKLASFEGNVTLNGKPQQGTLTYHVIQKKVR